MKIRVMWFLMAVSLVGLVGCEKKDAEKSGEEPRVEQTEKEVAEEGAGEGAVEEESPVEEVAEKDGEGEEADRSVTCKSVVTNVVNILTDARGNKAFFQKEDIPGLTVACKKAGTLENSPETAECLQKAEGVEAMLACEGAPNAMKTWADNEPSEDAAKGEAPKK